MTRLPATSLAAHHQLELSGAGNTQRDAILEHLAIYGPHTADELNEVFARRWPHADPAAAARRLTELKKTGQVKETGDRRLTRRGRWADVYRWTDPTEDALTTPPTPPRFSLPAGLIDEIVDAIEAGHRTHQPTVIRPAGLDIVVVIRPTI